MTDGPSHIGPTEAQAVEILQVAHATVRRLGAPLADVEDAAMMTVEKLLAKWSDDHVRQARSRRKSEWHGYIAAAAKNAYRDLCRKEARLKVREQRAGQGTDGGTPEARPGVNRAQRIDPTQVSDLDRYVARRVLADLIEEYLPPKVRQVAALALIDGLSSGEIAEELGLAVRTVNLHKREANRTLRTIAEIGFPPGYPDGDCRSEADTTAQ